MRISAFTCLFVAAFGLTAVAQTPTATAPAAGQCTSKPPMTNPAAGAGWNGWGAGGGNTRFQTAAQAGLTAAQVPNLKLKWAFGLPEIGRAHV